MVKNILVLVVDALRQDRLGVYGSHLNTPTIDSFASSAAVFENAFACSNVTDVSVTSIFSGKYPLEHGVLSHGTRVSNEEKGYANGTELLSEQLQAEGYETIIGDPVLSRWHRNGYSQELLDTGSDGNENIGVNRLPNWAISLGSSILNRVPKQVEQHIRDFVLEKTTEETTAEELTDLALEHLQHRDSDNPFFMFLHYWDVHAPYSPPNEYVEQVRSRHSYDDTPIDELIEENSLKGSITAESLRSRKLRGKTPETVGDIVAHYDASVTYVDDYIGKLLDGLADHGLEDTLVVLTADHGESLTEHGICFDHHGLYDQTIRVPLIIDAPNADGTRVKGLTQHFDLYPTILDMADSEFGDTTGVSLQSHISGDAETPPHEYVFAEESHTQRKRMVRSDQYKWITTLDGQGICRYCDREHTASEALFNVKACPEETSNLLESEATEAKVRRDKLKRVFEEWRKTLTTPQKGSGDANYDEEELEEKLQYLGYR